jgi:phosphosulfolactate synthase (CoM biosynthesis protein A)
MGHRYLADILEITGAYVDSLKFAGGSFVLMPRSVVVELIDLAHQHRVSVCTGGFIEYVLTRGCSAVESYIHECKELGTLSKGLVPFCHWLARVADFLSQREAYSGARSHPGARSERATRP